MELRIDQKKLMFFHHILNLPDKTLAKEIALIQMKFNYPGLITELLMTKYNLPDMKDQTKAQWKKVVSERIKMVNKETLLKKILKYKKLDHTELEKEEYKTKTYLRTLNLA